MWCLLYLSLIFLHNHLSILDLFQLFHARVLKHIPSSHLIFRVACPSSCIWRMTMHELFDSYTFESPKSLLPKALQYVLWMSLSFSSHIPLIDHFLLCLSRTWANASLILNFFLNMHGPYILWFMFFDCLVRHVLNLNFEILIMVVTMHSDPYIVCTSHCTQYSILILESLNLWVHQSIIPSQCNIN